MTELESELVAKWLDWLEHNLGRSPGTVRAYQGHINRLSQFLAKQHKVGVLEAKRPHLELFVGAWAHQQGVAIRSRKPIIAAVRRFYSWLKLTEHREDDPSTYLTYPNIGRPLPKVLPKIHAEDLLKDCDLQTEVGARDAALIGLLIGLGLRVEGVRQLNIGQFHMQELDNGALQMMLMVTEKGGKERLLPVPSVAQALLGIYLTLPERIAKQDYALLPDGNSVLFLQVNRGSCPEHEWYGEARRLSTRGIQHMLFRRGARAGVPREFLHPHAMRHFFGTELAERETDLRRIQLLMGHSSLATTTLYLHTSVRKLAQTMHDNSPIQHLDFEVAKLVKVLPAPAKRLGAP
jgi:site-specific recombinase XerD